MSLPRSLRHIIDEDLAAIRGELETLAPGSEVVLAGSLAFDEPWARTTTAGEWVLESDYDLYLLVPKLRRAAALRRDPRLRGLQDRLSTRAPVDPFVIWRPLLERGVVGMVGRSLHSGSFVDCRLDPRDLRANQARKALVRQRLLAPRETPERAGYQRVKAAVEALRAIILDRNPDLSPRALFSLRANQAWLNAWPEALPAVDRETLTALLSARLELGGPGPSEALLDRVGPWLDRFVHTEARRPLRPGHLGRPRSTELRAWAAWLRHGLLPVPGLDYDAALQAVLADPTAPRLAEDPSARAGFERRWRGLHLGPAPRGALLQAIDGALGNPTSGKGECYLVPRGSA